MATEAEALASTVINISPAQVEQYARSQYPEIREAGRLLLKWIEVHRAPADAEGLRLEDIGIKEETHGN